MKKGAAQILTFLKQDKSFYPGLIISIAFFLTSYFLYPHETPKTKVAQISDSKITQTKSIRTVTPTPPISLHKKSQPSVDNIPSIVTSSNTNKTKEISSNSNPSNSNSSTSTSSSNSNSNNQNIPTSTVAPDQLDNAIKNNNIPTVIPTTSPANNGNNALIGNSVNTIVEQVIPTAVPQSVGTIIANNGIAEPGN